MILPAFGTRNGDITVLKTCILGRLQGKHLSCCSCCCHDQLLPLPYTSSVARRCSSLEIRARQSLHRQCCKRHTTNACKLFSTDQNPFTSNLLFICLMIWTGNSHDAHLGFGARRPVGHSGTCNIFCNAASNDQDLVMSYHPQYLWRSLNAHSEVGWSHY